MRKLLILVSLVVISSHCYADEVITGFDTEKDIPILNEELRKIDVANQQVEDRVAVLEASAYTPTAANALTGSFVQVVNTQTGAVTTGSTVIPIDDTIPQNTEGNEVMTLAITPTNASNKLKITAIVFGANTGGGRILAALFQDSTAGALAAGRNASQGANVEGMVMFTHYMTAGTTSATTFKIRAGGSDAGTFTFNGVGGAREFGGVIASSITIEEIKV